MIRAVVFDLGGTLIDFNPRQLSWLDWEGQGLADAHRYLAGRGYDLPAESFLAYIRDVLPERWEGAAQGGPNLRLGDLLQETCARFGAQPSGGEIDEAVARYVSPLDREVVAYDDALEALAHLRERGLRIGLISNTMWPSAYHLEEMARFGLLPFFDHTLFSAEAGVWKPQPMVYQQAVQAIKVAPGEAVFVGDTPQHDILGAQRAGLRGVLRRSKGRPLNGVVPDAEIDTLSELPSLIDHWSAGTSIKESEK